MAKIKKEKEVVVGLKEDADLSWDAFKRYTHQTDTKYQR
jgi:hypothetical protein